VMDSMDEMESLLLKMEARNKATARLNADTARRIRQTEWLLVFTVALMAVAGLIVIAKAVWF
jgi:hypothetical protein